MENGAAMFRCERRRIDRRGKVFSGGASWKLTQTPGDGIVG